MKSLALALLASSASAMNIPHNAKRINVYGVGTLIDGYGLDQASGEGFVVDPVLQTLEESAPEWQQHSEALLRNKPKADAAHADTGEGGVEAARKLVSNHANVLRDVTNAMPRSQLYLARVGMDDAPYADEALREVSRHLLGCPSELRECRIETAAQARVWAATCAFVQRRIQATHVECPGRTPDLSEAAAAAMRTALAEVEATARAHA